MNKVFDSLFQPSLYPLVSIKDGRLRLRCRVNKKVADMTFNSFNMRLVGSKNLLLARSDV